MFLCAASQRHCLRYALALFPTLTGTGIISDSLRPYHAFYEPFSWQTASAKGKKENSGTYAASK